MKDSVRKDLLRKLSALSLEDNARLSFDLTNQIIKFFNSNPELTGLVGAGYLPLRDEVAPMYQELFRHVPVHLSYPVLVESEMAFAIPEGLPKGATWMEPPYHLVEPKWFLVPGIGFDLSGARLGRGKGYYDRYLFESDGLRIGLAWTEQIVDKVPVEGHDCHMDFIITEKFCWDVDLQKRF